MHARLLAIWVFAQQQMRRHVIIGHLDSWTPLHAIIGHPTTIPHTGGAYVAGPYVVWTASMPLGTYVGFDFRGLGF